MNKTPLYTALLLLLGTVPFVAADPASDAAGAYYLIAANSSSDNPADANGANDVAAAVTVAAV